MYIYIISNHVPWLFTENLDSLEKPNIINRSRIKELTSRCRNEIGRSKNSKNTKNGTRAKGKFELMFTVKLTNKL